MHWVSMIYADYTAQQFSEVLLHFHTVDVQRGVVLPCAGTDVPVLPAVRHVPRTELVVVPVVLDGAGRVEDLVGHQPHCEGQDGVAVCVRSEKESPLVDVVWVLVTHQRPLIVETAETVRLGDGGWTAGADVNSRAQVLRTELAG